MKKLIPEVIHWTVYGVVEGVQTTEQAYKEAVQFLMDVHDEDISKDIPTLEETIEAMKAELAELMEKKTEELTVADSDQRFYLNIALGYKSWEEVADLL